MKTRFSSSRGADTTLLCLLGVQVMVQTSGQMGLEILVWIPLRVRYDKTHELHNAIAFYTSYTLFWFFALLSLAPIGDRFLPQSEKVTSYFCKKKFFRPESTSYSVSS